MYEFWVVATRPLKDNGLGYTQPEAIQALEMIERHYRLMPETPSFYPSWRSLLVGHTVVGKIGHDARLVAGMLASGIAEILTFNDSDFRRFNEITVVSPKDLTSSPSI